MTDLAQYGKIEKLYSIDFGADFENFIKELYHFSVDEQWKSEYKIIGLINQYKNNIVHVVLMDIPRTKKVFLAQKGKYMYENVLDMKVRIRNKYKNLLKDEIFGRRKGLKFDNVFHMTDDEEEYNENVFSTIPFLIKYSDEKAPFTLDCFVDNEDIVLEKNVNYVLVGLRRAGKTTLLYKRALELINKGVDWNQIIYINFDDERLLEFAANDFDGC